jgi:hypothetical protein
MVDSNNLQSLYDFIDRAQNNRKYFPNVATNFRTPLRLIERELTEEERGSVDLIKSNLDQIIGLIYSKGGNKLTASSLEVYKKRIKSLIEDYENYGKDPSKMATWNRKILTRKTKDRKLEVKGDAVDSPITFPSPSENSEFQAADLILSTGKARIIVPKGITAGDVKRLKLQIDLLANILPSDNVEK